MKKPQFVIQLQETLGIELTHLPDHQPLWRVVEHLAMIAAFKARRDEPTATDIQNAALERMRMSVCKNTYLTDASGELIALNLHDNGLTDFPFEAAAALPGLQVLQLSNNQFISIHFPEGFPALRWVDVSESKHLFSFYFTHALPSLETFDAYSCNIGKMNFPAGFQQLKRIDLSRNISMTACVLEADCPALEWLDLSKNNLNAFHLPEGFQALTWLYLCDNRELRDVRFDHPLRKLEVLHLANCDLKELPASIILSDNLLSLYASGNTPKNIPYIFLGSDGSSNCIKEAQLWFSQFEKEKGEKNKRVKLMFLGNGTAGKSTLLCALEKKDYPRCICPDGHKSTHGVQIKTLSKNDVQFHVWDFGGQEIYHGTHKLFMQSPAVQLILFDPDIEKNALKGEKRKDPLSDEMFFDQPLEYWYETASTLSRKSRFLFLQNRLDVVKDEYGPAKALAIMRNEKFLQISALKGISVSDMEALMIDAAKSLPDYDMLMPPSWLKVRDFFIKNIESDTPRKTIDRQFFKDLCDKGGVDNNDALRNLLLDYLHHGGYLYSHHNLGDTIIADQKWALDAIYKLFDRDALYFDEFRSRSDGQILKYRIFDIWGDGFSDEHKTMFLSFMETCGICFKLNTDEKEPEVYIFPEYLPEKIHPAAARNWQDRTRDVVTFRYKLQWVNQYLISKFIARLGRKTDLKNVWRSGIQVESDQGWFRVELDYDEKEIVVCIERPALKTWLKPLLEALELQHQGGWKTDMHSRGQFSDFQWDKWSETGGDGQVSRGLEPEMEVVATAGNLDNLNVVPQESNIRVVLFFAANPSATKQVYHDREFAKMNEEYDKLKKTEIQLYFKIRSNVTVPVFMEETVSIKPHIIHFVGHGEEKELPDDDLRDSDLIFHSDDFREVEKVNSQTLKKMFERLLKEKCPLQMVFLNACLTTVQAQTISSVGLITIGSKHEIYSHEARRFAAGFYKKFSESGDIIDSVKPATLYAPNAENYIQVFKNGEEQLINW